MTMEALKMGLYILKLAADNRVGGWVGRSRLVSE
jgi:hypothetical protein